ncbi:cytochrome bd-I oxidase subunit CydX [Hoeflea sp.]|jgi:cytochrome bd-I ubiquinol oxidase subunit X
MWYFAWLLGLPLAAMFAVVNAMWLELQEDSRIINDQGGTPPQGKTQR